MIEFWAVIGRACMDAKFRGKVIDEARKVKPKESVEKLKELQRFLAKNRFRLSRQDVSNVQHFFTQLISSQLYTIDSQCKSDKIGFPDDLDYCAVVGLALIDKAFRQRLYDSAKGSTLEYFLLGKDSGSPLGFEVPDTRVGQLSDLIISKTARKAMHEATTIGWRPPKKPGQSEDRKKAIDQIVPDVISSVCPESAIFELEKNTSFYSITPGKVRFVALLAYAKLDDRSGFLDDSLIHALDQLLAKFGLGGAPKETVK